MKRLRVLQVVASSRGGGAEVLRCLVKGLDPQQFESTVIMPDDGGHIVAADFEALGVRLERFAQDTGFNFSEWRRLRRFIRGGQFDIVHVHGSRAGLWGRLAAWGLRRPRLAFSVHGLSIVHYTGLKRLALVTLERALGRLTDVTVCTSHAEQVGVLAWRLVPADKTRVVWNGIDLDRLATPPMDRAAARAALGLPADIPLLVTVCRLNKPRDFRTLLAGLAAIAQAQPAVRLLIAGDGPQRPQVAALVAEYHVAAHVQLLGMVRNVGEILAAADVALLITAGWEGLPLAALEAMAVGRPFIVSDVGGNREAVVDGETGYVIPPGAVEALAQTALRLLAQPGLARAMGEAGARRVRAHFTLERMAAEMGAIYQALAAGQP